MPQLVDAGTSYEMEVDFCMLCNKRASVEHMESAAHRERVTDEYVTDNLVGTAECPMSNTVRRHTDGKIGRGLPGTPFANGLGEEIFTREQAVKDNQPMLTQKAVQDFWGGGITQLPEKALVIINSKNLLVKMNNQAAKTIARRSVKGSRLAMVSFKGSGAYDHENRLVYFDEMPTDRETVSDEYLLETRIPDHHGWWPVTVIQIDEDDEALQNRGEKHKVLVTCIYQLQESVGNPNIQGWWIIRDPITGYSVGYEHGDEPTWMHDEDLGEDCDDDRSDIPQPMTDAHWWGVAPQVDEWGHWPGEEVDILPPLPPWQRYR